MDFVGKRPQPGPKRPGKKFDGKEKKSASMTKRIRDVRRLLSKPNLDPGLRTAQEKRLAELLSEADTRKHKARERKLAIIYHRIRFFERVKLERRIKQLQRMEKDVPSLSTADAAELAQAKEDLEYVQNFPKGEKYVSVLKSAEEPEAQEHLEKERVRLRALVKQQLAEAALVAEPDEGRGLAAATAAAKATVQRGAIDAQKRKSSAQDSGTEEEEEDDDFFLQSDSDASDGDEDKKDKIKQVQAQSSDGTDDAHLSSDSDVSEDNSDDSSEGAVEDDIAASPLENSSEDEEEEEKEERKHVHRQNTDRAPNRGNGNTSRGGGQQRYSSGGRGNQAGFNSGRGGGSGSASSGRGGGRGGNTNSSVAKRPFIKGGVEKPRSQKPAFGSAAVRDGSSKPLVKPTKKPSKKPEEKTPVRSRSDGGRKRRKK